MCRPHHLLCLLACLWLDQVKSSTNTQWTLVDRYEFGNINNDQLHRDTQTWLIDDEPGNLCRGESIYQFSCHRKSNVFIASGLLNLEATVNDRAGSSRYYFNTAKISCRKAWLYGRFEVRARLPDGRLLRPVLALRPKLDRHDRNWLANGQINGLVYAQASDFITSGLHYAMADGQSYVGGKFKTRANITHTLHTYGLEWTNTGVRWSFDGLVYFQHNVSSPFDHPFYFTLQLGVGGPEFDQTFTHSVTPGDAHGWRQNRFQIEYVRVYQRDGDASRVLAHTSAGQRHCACWCTIACCILSLAMLKP